MNAVLEKNETIAQVVTAGSHEEIIEMLNLLRLDVVNAIISNDWTELSTLHRTITEALGDIDETDQLIRAELVSAVGQLKAFQGMIRVLREARPSPAELQEATRYTRGRAVLLALQKRRSATAGELREAIDFPDETAFSKLGAHLEQAGLIRRERIGRHVRYELTARGYIVASDIEKRAEISQNAVIMMFEQLQEELRKQHAEIIALRKEIAANTRDGDGVRHRFGKGKLGQGFVVIGTGARKQKETRQLNRHR